MSDETRIMDFVQGRSGTIRVLVSHRREKVPRTPIHSAQSLICNGSTQICWHQEREETAASDCMEVDTCVVHA